MLIKMVHYGHMYLAWFRNIVVSSWLEFFRDKFQISGGHSQHKDAVLSYTESYTDSHFSDKTTHDRLIFIMEIYMSE